MEKTQLKKLLVEAGQELETISKTQIKTEALEALFKKVKSDEELKSDTVLSEMIHQITKRGGIIKKNANSNLTLAKNAGSWLDEALSKLK